jgi:hypothetical protein
MPLGAFRINTLGKVLDTGGYGERTSDSIPLTVLGNAQISTAQSKFGVSSVLFDGTGDGLNANQPLLPATDDWTVEAWVYPTTINATDYWFSQYAAGVSGRTTFYYTATGAVGLFINTGPSFTTSASAVTANTWTHIAWVRNGSDHRIYINGVDSANASASGTITQSYNFVVGAQDTAGSNGTIGYMDEVRVSNVARYTSGFTPSTTAFTPDGATLLLIHGDGTNGSKAILDDPSNRSSDSMSLTLSGNTQISTAQSKFGSSSIYMDGTGDYITISDNATNNLDFGTGDFTIEWFQYLTALDRFAIDFRAGSSALTKILIYSYPTDGAADDLYFYNTANRITALNCLSANTWQHIVAQRESGVTRLFVDGAQVGSDYADTNNYAHTQMRIWHNSIGPENYTPPGYVDEFRISSFARYSGTSYTVPTAAFEPDAGTELLIHGDGTNGSTTITDDPPA